MDFAVFGVKLKGSEKKEKYLGFAWEVKKTVEHESDYYTNCNWISWYSHRRIHKGNRGLGNKRTSGDHPNYCSIKKGQNTEKSPGDLRFAVIQTPVKDHKLSLMGKILKK